MPDGDEIDDVEEASVLDDWFPFCVVQYSTVMLGKLFWVVSSLYF